jgi:outer membrane lipoprotein carrier protein
MLLLSFLLIFFNISFANATGTAHAAENLISIFSKINTITADFKQEVKDNSGQIISTSSGSMIIQRPNKFRWSTQQPMVQLAIANGQQVWLYQPDLQQVTISKMSREIGQTPLAILSGSTQSLQQNFAIRQLTSHEFTLTAQKKTVPFHEITLVFNNSNELTQMQLKDELGQTTILYFTKLRINTTVSDNNFNFAIPKGVDVIHNA